MNVFPSHVVLSMYTGVGWDYVLESPTPPSGTSLHKEAAIALMLKILQNVVKDPANPKFRTLKMSNPTLQASPSLIICMYILYICIYIYIYIRKLPCSDVHLRENDKAAAWNLCNSVHLRILLHVFRANL